MASDSRSVISNIVGTVVGGLILALLTWLASLFPPLWALIVSAWNWVWSVLALPVSIPLGVLVLMIGVVTLAGVFAARRTKRSRIVRQHSMVNEETPSPVPIELSQLERGVIRVLAGADGAWLSNVEIAGELRTSNLIIE